MISAEEFIALLEEKDLVPEDLLDHLRRQVAESIKSSRSASGGKSLTAAQLAKWLVDRGHLSRLLAQRLLSKAEESAEPASAAAGGSPEAAEQQEVEDDLDLAPLEEESSAPPAAKKKSQPAPEREKPRQPTAPGAAGKASAKQPTQAQQKEPDPLAAAGAGSLLDEELPSLGAGGPAGMGPLDGLLADATLDAAAAAGGSPLVPVALKKKGLFGGFGRKRKKAGKKENVWDSALLLIGGGALLALVILGSVLVWALTRRGGDEMLKLANDDYRAGSYTQAIHKYGLYLEKFPNHSGASMARVRCGLARLRQATDGASDWPNALEVANEVLAEIAPEKEFSSEARPELTALLPKITQGLAEKASKQSDPVLVERAEEALALVNKYLPKSSRPVKKLADVEFLLRLTRREIVKGEQLDKAISAMQEAVAQGNSAEAYKIRIALLKDYPGLIDNEKLREAVLAVSGAERSAVKTVEKEQAAEIATPSTSVMATVALARRTAESDPVPGVEGQVIFVLAKGAAYGVDAATGKVLWRRPVGFDANGRSPGFAPLPISERPGSDAVLVDQDRHEVIRVDAATGQLRWRHPIGERFDAHPVVADDRILVATRSGRLVTIDLEGHSTGHIQLPQALRVAPTVDSRRSRIYQVAEHSNLFVLSLTDGQAKQVVYLGHEPGSITIPPVIVSRFLIVTENNGAESATLRILSLESGDQEAPVTPVQEIPLKGHVDTAPVVSGARVLVATDQGEIKVFEISATDAENPLGKIAEGKAAGDENLEGGEGLERLIRFPLLLGGQVWIADSQLTRYDIDASRGRLQPKGIANERSASLQPLRAIGQSVVHVRWKVGTPGVLVSALGMDEGQLIWETQLATPLCTEPMVDAQTARITAVTSSGAIYQLDAAAIKGRTVIDEPAVALKMAELRQPLTDVVRLEGGLLAMAAADGPKQLPLFDPQEGQNRVRWLFLPDPLGCRPMAFAGGLLAPCKVGQVFLLDPRSGEKLAEPFQPRLENGVQLAWREPALIGDKEIVLADGRNTLYRIGIKAQPKPHLAALATAELSDRIVSPVAACGAKVVYAVDAVQTLLAFELPGLTRGQQWPLSGRCVWGPRQVGDHVILATDDDQLYCLDANQKLLWQIPLPYGRLAGTPLEIDDHFILAAARGVIWRVEAASGKELAKIETGQPLGTGPVLLGGQLLVAGHDGSLYVVNQP